MNNWLHLRSHTHKFTCKHRWRWDKINYVYPNTQLGYCQARVLGVDWDSDPIENLLWGLIALHIHMYQDPQRLMSILDMDQNGRISCPAEGPGARTTASFPTIWPAKYILWKCVAGLDGWFTRNHRRCHMKHIHSEQLQRPLWSLSAGVGNVEVHGVLSCCAWAEIIIEWCCWIEGTAPDMFGICIVSLYVFYIAGKDTMHEAHGWKSVSLLHTYTFLRPSVIGFRTDSSGNYDDLLPTGLS